MKKMIKMLIGILVINCIIIFGNIVNAASTDINTSTEVETGTITITATVTAAQWNLNLKVNGELIANSSELENYEENITRTISGTYNATEPGTLSITLEGDITDVDQGNTIVKKSKKITVTKKEEPKPAEPEPEPVKEKEQQNTTPQKQETDSESVQKPKEEQKQEEKEPEYTITETSKTVYGSEDGVNIRSGYSTTSEAIGSLKKGQEFEATGIVSNGWTRIKYNGKSAYIKSEFLTETKPKSSNNELKSLKIEETTLDPKFSKDVLSYSATVGKDVESVKIEAVADDENAKVLVSGNEKLKTGENSVKITVTAEDGTEKQYKITVTKESENKLQLKSLEISGITLTEKFSPDKYEYNIKLTDKTDVKKLDIKAKANQEDATVEILGNEGFKIGENVITIMVKSKDEKENITYQIIVNKPEIKSSDTKVVNTIQNSNDTFLYVAIGIFATALILIIIIIVRSIKKSKKDDYDDLDDEDYNNINYTEEIYGLKQKENKNYTNNFNEDINNQDTENKTNTLYDVEKEVDFSDVEEVKPKRKGGKHSK